MFSLLKGGGGVFHRFTEGFMGDEPKLAVLLCSPLLCGCSSNLACHRPKFKLEILADVFWLSALSMRYFHLCLTPPEVVLNF